MRHNPIIGYVSFAGMTFTMHYKRVGSVEGISRRGYDDSIFDEAFPYTPIVRFDLVKDISELPPALPFTNTDFYIGSIHEANNGNTEGEVNYYKSKGVVVQSYEEYKR